MLTAFANAFRTPDLRRKLLFVLMIIVIFRLGSQIPAPGVNVANVQSCIDRIGRRQRQPLQPDQPVLRRCAAPADDLRARDHALHHREHHPAAARRGDPAAGGPQEGGPVRPDQDHPVHPLPDAGPRAPPGDRHRGAGPLGQPAPGLQPGPAAQRRHRDVPGHGHHDDRRHRRDHVARRADHRARRRQRHVDPDLHPGRRDLPGRAVGGRRTKGWWTFGIVLVIGLVIVAAVIFIEQAQRRIPVQYARRMVGRKMFGGSSTYIPLKVNQAGVIPVIFASSLLYLPAMLASFNQNSDVQVGPVDQQLPRPRRPPALHAHVLPADRLLHLLLRLDHLQPRKRSPTT